MPQEMKVVLCRPQSGLNDFLCEIERCCRYAQAHGRHVVVDSNYPYAKTFHDAFSNYFVSTQHNLILDARDYLNWLNTLAVYPAALTGKVNSYQPVTLKVVGKRPDGRNFITVERESRQALSFDFAASYPQPLLVHQQSTGGELSLYALQRMRLHDALVDKLMARLRRIGSPFVGVHVRNTDYKTDYQGIIRDLKAQSIPKIFLATDELSVRVAFQRVFGDRLVAFSALPDKAHPIHLLPSLTVSQRRELNGDAILDALTLAFADRVVVAKTLTGNYSGFSLLAKNLNANRQVLLQLMGRCDPFFSRWPMPAL